MVDNIKKYIVGTTNDKICRLVSFVTIYLQSYNGKGFSCWNNNYCGAYVGLNNYTNNVIKLFFELSFIKCSLKSDMLIGSTTELDS